MEIKKKSLLKNLDLWQQLDENSQKNLQTICQQNKFTFQQQQQILKIFIDLEMWNEKAFLTWWKEQNFTEEIQSKKDAQKRYEKILDYWHSLKNEKKSYQNFPRVRLNFRKKEILEKDNGEKIFGMCPVASEKTLCCNLRTIDAVQNCSYECSYCSIKTFYKKEAIIFEQGLENKLKNISLDPKKYYHFGTGQSSDSLLFGNKNGMLEKLCQFAKDNPNILLEFKTKSNNVQELITLNPPKNIVCSWTLNPNIIIDNEELGTPSLEKRLLAAQKVHDQGIKVAFHFHPLIYFENYEEEYRGIAEKILSTFDPQNVLYISFGTLTFIRPVIKDLRLNAKKSKILQMPLVECEGRFSYPKEIKIELFSKAFQMFKPWHEKVFFYLCMEPYELWEPTLGKVYKNNEEFENNLLQASFDKVLN